MSTPPICALSENCVSTTKPVAPETWKAFDQNPLTHSAAHHLVAILDLREELGYARVSDVATRLAITRGSASITLDRLVKRGLVTKDRNKFLGLSEEGERIAREVQAKKFVMKKLLIELLGVDDRQADVDTCKIEHLISCATAAQATRMLQFLEEGGDAVAAFLEAYRRFAPRASAATEESNMFRYYTANTAGDDGDD